MAPKDLPSNQSTGFLDMPLELRYLVYQECLVFSAPIDMAYVFDNILTVELTTSLLLVSKAISSEAVDVFYGKNIFAINLFDETGWQLMKYLTEDNIRKIRKVQLVMTSFGAIRHATVDWTSWMPILRNLTALTIVAQQPLESSFYRNAQTWEESMEMCSMEAWTAWLEMLLSNISGQLPAFCTVEVDNDDAEETSALIEQHLGKKYRETRTGAGDWLFGNNPEYLCFICGNNVYYFHYSYRNNVKYLYCRSPPYGPHHNPRPIICDAMYCDLYHSTICECCSRRL